MNIPFTILFFLLAVVALTVGKAVLVSRFIRDEEYSRRNFATISVLFLAATAQSASSQCGYLGCGWSLRFGWVPQILRSVFGVLPMPDAQFIVLAIAVYAVLSIYFFGHLLGWAIYAFSRTKALIG
jgi:hypothetical protein